MTPTETLNAFAQSVYLVIKGRYFDGITGDDGIVYVNQVIDWTNQFCDELENELTNDGKVVDWWFMREADYALGTAVLGARSISLPTAVDKVITNPKRLVQITVDGIVVSQWKVVHPRDMANKSGEYHKDTCAVIGTSLAFSRSFNANEAGGAITGDVTLSLTRLSTTKLTLLKTVKPKQLLVLGVAKNASLPDIVQGGLSPSYSQKYQQLLGNAIARSEATSEGSTAERDDFSGVTGVY